MPHNENWKKGPLPPNTWHWGGVVLVGQESWGFYFADFCGDHVKIVSTNKKGPDRIVKPEEVAWYNNSLDMPPRPEKVKESDAIPKRL
jgi:hypothetical protein